ncbi:hypothetical protein Droror1_Dr00016622, partial [Drosera rotundifolia]
MSEPRSKIGSKGYVKMRIRGRKDEDSPENGRAVVKLGFLADALKREERELGVEGK